MSLMTDMPEAQRSAYALLLEVCGMLWAKTVRRADVHDIQLAVLRAICVAEAHLPATEADIKLHDLLHLACDVITAYGRRARVHAM